MGSLSEKTLQRQGFVFTLSDSSATRCNTLQHAATRCKTRQHTATPFDTLHRTATIATPRNTLQHAMQHTCMLGPRLFECTSVLQCVAVCCSVLQCGSVFCSVLQCGLECVAGWCSVQMYCSVLLSPCLLECTHVFKCVEVCCSVFQRAAVCCSVLQCAAVCCSVLQCAAVCCSVLQCSAVCCSVLLSLFAQMYYSFD